MKNNKLKILILTGDYIPGFRGGGPIRSIANIVKALGDEFDFRIATMDRDFGCNEQYKGIHPNDWQSVGKAKVFYISPENLNWIFLKRFISSTPHDILYLNSFFSLYFGIIPLLLRRFKMIPIRTTIFAPRGQFSSGAIKIKGFKKQIYLFIEKFLDLHKNLIWHVSSKYEEEDLYRVFKKKTDTHKKLDVVIAPNLTAISSKNNFHNKNKKPGFLKIIFLSRISPKKNLEGALKMLKKLNGFVTFNIYGPLEDNAYWEKCLSIIEKLPNNITVKYKGVVEHDEVVSVMAKNELFLMPTKGENYGHVIIEAMAAGLPVLISDQTPWRNLEEAGIGWDISLKHTEKFRYILQQFIDMEQSVLENYSKSAFKYSSQKIKDNNSINQNRNLFLKSI